MKKTHKNYFATILIILVGSFVSFLGTIICHYFFYDNGRAGFFMFLAVTLAALFTFFTAPDMATKKQAKNKKILY